ncbi:MAG: hypothetical protein EON92_03905 [Burkholderiales bacterium]|nr:MAG: hypothetical protein EON92_03905 [Burkholderiales bacterium]
MSQNLIDLTYTADALATLDATLESLERQFAGLLALNTDQRRHLTKMGDKSEAFCRQTVDVLGQNTGLLPRNFDYEGLRRDMETLDALRPRLMRLTRLHERASDTEMALGSDVMTQSLEGYAFLKVAGKNEGLDHARRALSARFTRSAPKADAQTLPPT